MYRKKDPLAHAPPGQVGESSERRARVMKSRSGVTPGAFPVQPKGSVTASNHPSFDIDPGRRITDIESNQDEITRVQDCENRFDDNVLPVVDARPVQDERVVYATAEHITTQKKWYQRPLFWVGLLAIVIIVSVLAFVLQPKGTSTLTPAPVPDLVPSPAAALTPEEIACDFIGRTSLSQCLSTRIVQSGDPDYSINGLTIPSEIGLLTSLIHLELKQIELTGSIPSDIGLLNQLTYLELWQIGLTGSIPSSIGNLVQLTTLKVDNNELNGTIPFEIQSLTNLQSLDFQGNSFVGTIPDSVISLTNLIMFALFDNEFEGSLPDALCSHVSGFYIDCGEMICSCCTDQKGVSCPTVAPPPAPSTPVPGPSPVAAPVAA